MNNALLTSKNENWETPQWLFDELNAKYSFNLDPCCTAETAKCNKFFAKETNGLNQSWAGHTVFMNPPYGREIGQWMKKAYLEALQPNTLIVCLVPARVDTAWWCDYATRGDVYFFQGRLKFGSAKNGAPFPSALVIFGSNHTSELQYYTASTGAQA
jgi:site-specific DNA-methyltransferase (adenine-specific)